MAENEKLRIDKYLWSIRVFKTRALATDACHTGKVKLNGVNVKPSKPVSIGDEYHIKTPARKWIIRVTGLLSNRVKFADAINYYVDITPEDTESVQPTAFVFQTGKRKSKIGRPTKKEKRRLDDFLGR